MVLTEKVIIILLIEEGGVGRVHKYQIPLQRN